MLIGTTKAHHSAAIIFRICSADQTPYPKHQCPYRCAFRLPSVGSHAPPTFNGKTVVEARNRVKHQTV